MAYYRHQQHSPNFVNDWTPNNTHQKPTDKDTDSSASFKNSLDPSLLKLPPELVELMLTGYFHSHNLGN